MDLLCDTSAVLMLLRLAPGMLTDHRYGCVTVQAVWEEITRTQRFKTRYPWRDSYRRHIRARPLGEVETEEYKRVLAVVQVAERAGMNTRTGHPYGLSHRDRSIAAAAVTHGWGIATCDGNLADFLVQQFEVSNNEPLGLVNRWLEQGLFAWDEARQRVVEDWLACNEPRPTAATVARFEELAGVRFPC